MNKEEKAGYEAAIKALRDMLSGKGQQGQQNNKGSNNGNKGQQGLPKGTDESGNGAQTPELNPQDKKKAEQNAKKGSGNSQASKGARQEAAESGVSDGGFISQKVGAEIARSEGYDEEDCKEKSTSEISNDWKEHTIEACNQNNSPGLGNFIAKMKEYYMTSHDWKSDLKKYVGRALSHVETDEKLGKKKWLANDELKKYDIAAEDALSSVIFMIDCSGSLSDDLLQRIISECFTIVKKKKITEVTYCYYDDGIRQIDTNKVSKFDGKLNKVVMNKIRGGKASSEIHGRGGNDEDQAMKDLQKLLKNGRQKVELVMWFTDGYVYVKTPSRPKNIKHMIWVCYDNTQFTAPDNSKVIHINSKDIGK
jgi:predicted metal-dependent peptidase